MKNNIEFYKEKPTDKIWWVDDGSLGDYAVSFDRKKIYTISLRIIRGNFQRKKKGCSTKKTLIGQIF